MEARPILFPLDLHFTCRMCSGCCRAGWDIVLSEQELARFNHVDWAASRERLRDVELVHSRDDGTYTLGHVGDACAFLDDDDLCAIHKELGLEAKPFMCKQFPNHVVSTPEGIIATLDFACPTVVADDGAPIREQEPDLRARIAEWAQVGSALRGAMASATLGDEEPNVTVRKGTPLAWRDYLALEAGLQHVLTDFSRPLTERLLLIDNMIDTCLPHATDGTMESWVKSLEAERWATLSSTPPSASPMRQRALVAAAIAAIEDAWGRRSGHGSSAASRVGLATALVPSRRTVFLATADAAVDLDRMRKTRFAQDDPALTGPIARFLLSYFTRKSLIAGTSVLQGSRYLALFFGTIRWYSVARAVLAGREATEVVDVNYALRLVEQTLSRSPSLRAPRFVSLVNFLCEHVAPARSLYPSSHPS